MNELSLFAGAGGGILGGYLLGWRTVCAVEFDAYAASVLVARQNDGCLPPFPIWDDVRTFDGHPWRGRVDIVSGGFPCQDISAAGKGAGITGERSGLWKHMARIVGEVRPRFVWVENSPLLVSRGLDTVLADLAALGYDARWGIVGADDAGAPHQRERVWVVADAKSTLIDNDFIWEANTGIGREDVPDAAQQGLEGHRNGSAVTPGRSGEGFAGAVDSQRDAWWATERGLGRVAHGVANRVDRLRCIGNGQVSAVVRLAWEVLNEPI